MRCVGVICVGAFIPVMGQATPAQDALIAAMNESDCTLTTAEANEVMPRLGISRPEAIALSRQMMRDGVVTFADDEETLVLLPPACTK